ncbi:putative chaperone protein HSP31 [Ascodesmis nigricans]|uniref:D-lactate dehydratase n=1 Tax=Ascodesmis nigricans TaxID=341454 RepID=A0A4S2MJE4_9PEZI|nr:putative chaperone protein HSP31 [Ascodesmis nigricans]
MSKPSILFILTSQKSMSNGDPTGWYLPELAHPYHVLSPVASITVASPHGGEAPLDPSSAAAFSSDEISSTFLRDHSSVYKTTVPISSLLGKASSFAAIFFVGGHGPMYDLSSDPSSLSLVREFAEAGKVVAAVCHGPAGLLNVTLEDGKYLLDGEEVTGFSNEEEKLAGAQDKVPYSLEDELRKRGAKYVKAEEAWGEKVVVARGGKLITGENPASSLAIGEAIKRAIGA